MKKILLMICGLMSLVVLSACTKQASTQVSFDKYQMTRFLADKIYHQTPIENSGENITIYQSQQDSTGVSNSLVINKVPLLTGVSLTQVVDLNMQQIKETLQQYKSLATRSQNVTCAGKSLSGYYVSFEYALGEKQNFYVGQYFFVADDMLFLVSFHSKDESDLKSFAQSTKTITCN